MGILINWIESRMVGHNLNEASNDGWMDLDSVVDLTFQILASRSLLNTESNLPPYS